MLHRKRVQKTITIRIRKPRVIVLATAPSDQEGKPDYRIYLDPHNMVCCTCKGWRYNGHTCKHLTRFRDELASAAEKIARKKK